MELEDVVWVEYLDASNRVNTERYALWPEGREGLLAAYKAYLARCDALRTKSGEAEMIRWCQAIIADAEGAAGVKFHWCPGTATLREMRLLLARGADAKSAKL